MGGQVVDCIEILHSTPLELNLTPGYHAKPNRSYEGLGSCALLVNFRRTTLHTSTSDVKEKTRFPAVTSARCVPRRAVPVKPGQIDGVEPVVKPAIQARRGIVT